MQIFMEIVGVVRTSYSYSSFVSENFPPRDAPRSLTLSIKTWHLLVLFERSRTIDLNSVYGFSVSSFILTAYRFGLCDFRDAVHANGQI